MLDWLWSGVFIYGMALENVPRSVYIRTFLKYNIISGVGSRPIHDIPFIDPHRDWRVFSIWCCSEQVLKLFPRKRHYLLTSLYVLCKAVLVLLLLLLPWLRAMLNTVEWIRWIGMEHYLIFGVQHETSWNILYLYWKQNLSRQ